MRLKAAFLVVCIVLSMGQWVQAQVPEQGRTMCAAIEKEINRLAAFTQTSCRAGGGNTKESMSFLVISLGVVWDNPDMRQAWLESVVEAAGAALNSTIYAAAKVDEIIVADPSQLAERVAYALPAPVVKDLQGKLKTGSIKQAEIYTMIEKELIRKPIQAR